MERYFDLFLYLANWGTRRFSMSLPKRMVDEADLKKFLVDQDGVTVYTTQEKLIVDVIRDEVEDEKIAFLVRLHDGDDPHLGTELRRRVRANVAASTEAPQRRRTVSELRNIAGRLAAERERAVAERAQAEQLRREKEQAEAKKRRLDALAARGEAAWREVESMIELRNPSGYEKALALLIDLRDLARNQSRADEFGRRLAEVRSRHQKKGRFLERLAASALD